MSDTPEAPAASTAADDEQRRGFRIEDDPDGLNLLRPRRAVPGVGRVTLLTEEVHKAMVGYLRGGATVKAAALAAGIDKGRHYEWVSRGRRYQERLWENPDDTDDFEEYFRLYYVETTKAQAQPQVRAALVLADLMRDGHDDSIRLRAATFLLERRDPDEWGRNSRVEVTGDGGGPVQVEDVTDREGLLARRLRERVLAEGLLTLEAEPEDVPEAAEVVESSDGDDDGGFWQYAWG